MAEIKFGKPLAIEITKLGVVFEVDYDAYSDAAKRNAIEVGLRRIGNDTCAGHVRKNFPPGVAGTELFNEIGMRLVRTRFANLANADVKESNVLAKWSDAELEAEMRRRKTQKAA